ncbi:IPT/TIG domain-containing protein [Chitinophaga rupis]|uniref:IPT/TIG domain-containing protein n=1 Tax=Chitinophaga rupis TaxID=573321 RepID=A0A1H8F9V0_9BACT|nr:FG-GAP-like repeat-containing protein [Chitinophaga rupis]SEN28224.1 IPT/TIG domain-containing protein [Chitinophaga rupis]
MKQFSPVTARKWVLFLSIFFLSLQTFAQPVISSFSPAAGAIGTPVTITGTGFSAVPANNIVFFGAVKAAVTAASSTSLTVTVPAGATFMPMSVTVNHLTAYSAKPFMVTFPDGGPFTGGSFERQTSLTTSLYPFAVAITDLDGDGKPDLAAACNGNVPASTLSVFRNTGAGSALSFSVKKDLPIADMPYAVAAGDLDGDGKPDLAATYISGGGNVAVYKNTSSPGVVSMAAPVTYATGTNPYKVLIGDIDRDGKPDLVISNYLAGSITVLRNTSAGGVISFAPKVDLTTAPLSYGIAIADLDGDGKLDIATTAPQTAILAIHRNTSAPGTISFDAAMDITVPTQPVSLTAGDIDGDGKADIAVVDYAGFSVLRNTSAAGSISFGPLVSFPFSSPSSERMDIAMGDLDGDAKPDLAISDEANAVFISKNTSATGTVSFAPDVKFFAEAAFRVVIGDLNGDGKPEMVAPDFTGNALTLFRNRITDPYISSFDPAEAVEGTTVTISGTNFSGVTAVSFGGVPAASFTVVNATTITAIVGKGAPGEIVVTNAYGTAKIDGFIFHGPPVISSFTPLSAKTGDTITITGKFLTDVTAVTLGGTPAASFTINSHTSISAVVGAGSSGSVSVASPYGPASLPGFTYYPPPAITSFTPSGGDKGTVITITGTNFTGVSKVLVGGAPVASFTVQSATTITAVISEGGTGSVAVTAQGGTALSSGVFAFPPPTVTSFSPLSGPAGTTVTITGTNFRSDVNANYVYFGAVKAVVKAATRTALTVTVPTGATYAPLTVTVNNNTAYAGQPFNMTYNGGDTGITDVSFAWKLAGAVYNRTHDVFMADLDGDSRSDLVYCHDFDGSVAVLHNTSTGGMVSFAPGTNIDGIYLISRMAVADITGDGKLDIIFRDAYFNTPYVCRNISTPGHILFAEKVALPEGLDPLNLLINDFDGDGKADIIGHTYDGFEFTTTISVFRNTGDNGIISFAPAGETVYEFFGSRIRSADFDNDGKPDIALAGGNRVRILKNSSTPGNISFVNNGFFEPANNPSALAVADFDNDHKPDLVLGSGRQLIVYRNISSSGNIAFAPPLTYETGTYGIKSNLQHIAIGQLDGDGLPDIAVSDNGGLLLFRNTSGQGTLSLGPPEYFDVQDEVGSVTDSDIGDLDGDGKADIAVSNFSSGNISVFRNQQGEKIVALCSVTDTTLTADITGTSYQWQVNNGSGFSAVADNANYTGAATASLKMSAIPESWNGYQYRCVVDGNAGKSINLELRTTIIQSGTAAAEASPCPEIPVAVTFNPTNVDYKTTIELWESTNGSAFAPLSSQVYFGGAMRFDVEKDTVTGVRKYFFVIKPRQGLSCAPITHSDTTTITIEEFKAPVLAVNGPNLTVTNTEAGVEYRWQVQNSAGEWTFVIPSAEGPAYTVRNLGTYRVQAMRTACGNAVYSAPQTMIITAIDPVTPESVGMKLFPNPVSTSLTIGPLKLAHRWQTLDIYRTDGQLLLAGYDISNQTRVTLNTESLTSGTYTAVLRRKAGQPVVIKFVKQ